VAAATDSPGVTLEAFSLERDVEFRTGVAGFLGPAGAPLGAPPAPALFTSWPQFAEALRAPPPDGLVPDELLYDAVQGFFANGGTRCWVTLYDPAAGGDPLKALHAAVQALAGKDDVDLVCAPSLLAFANALDLQRQLVRSCQDPDLQRDDWFLILDSPPPGSPVALGDWVSALRAEALRPADAALYYPWVVPGGSGFEALATSSAASVPPSGHVAGVYAHTDDAVGPHKAPANQDVQGIVDVAVDPGAAALPAGVNALRPFPGRGIRVWGARTLVDPAAAQSPTDVYVGVRRLVLTLRRWLVQVLQWVVMEPNTFGLWVRVRREVGARLNQLYLQGAFQGRTPEEAFYVKCDEENNPDDARAAGQLRVDVGVAPSTPKEFITIRLVRSPDRFTVA
jgi:hypothetical protein